MAEAAAKVSGVAKVLVADAPEYGHAIAENLAPPANLKEKIVGGGNLSKLESCYTPFLEVNNEKVEPKISPSCNSVLCTEQSYLIARFHWQKDFPKNAKIHYGFIDNQSKEIINDAFIPPPPFIITSDTRIDMVLDNDKKLRQGEEYIETYSMSIPVFFYDPLNWEINVTAISEKEEDQLKGLKVKGTNGSSLFCPDKNFSVTRSSDRIRFSDDNPLELQILLMSNVGWNFAKGGTEFESNQYCGFTSYDIEWKEKNGGRITLWNCHKRENGVQIFCERR